MDDIREGREFHEAVRRDPEQTAEDDEKALEPRWELGGTWRTGRGNARDFRRQHTHGYRPICGDSGTLRKRQPSVSKISRRGNRLHLVLKRRYPIVNAPSVAPIVGPRKRAGRPLSKKETGARRKAPAVLVRGNPDLSAGPRRKNFLRTYMTFRCRERLQAGVYSLVRPE